MELYHGIHVNALHQIAHVRLSNQASEDTGPSPIVSSLVLSHVIFIRLLKYLSIPVCVCITAAACLCSWRPVHNVFDAL